MERRPDFQMPQFTTPNATALVLAWRYLVKSQYELQPNGPWMYDLVDISRQVVSNMFYDIYSLFSIAYNRHDMTSATLLGTLLIEVITDTETLLNSNVNFLLGNWLESAKSLATTESQRQLYEFDARNQITLWGPTGQIEDYAAKSWAGLYSSYYLERWNFFIDSVIYAMSMNTPFNKNDYDQAILLKEQEWCLSNTVFPTTPSGNTIAIVNSLLYRYANSSSVDFSYTVIQNTDSPGNDIHQAWTKDVQQLKILCAMDPYCTGFNSNGWMKSNLSSRVSSIGTELYIKNG
jgi:alpha-N-acetylglucosaminidase